MIEDVAASVAFQAIVLLYPVWRIFKRAGLHPAWSMSVLVPYLGLFVCGLLLACLRWKFRVPVQGPT